MIDTEVIQQQILALVGKPLITSYTCESWKDENWLYRPGACETAGALYQKWLGWDPHEKVCLSYTKDCQFWCGVCVDRGWPTPVDEVTLLSSAQFLRAVFQLQVQ